MWFLVPEDKQPIACILAFAATLVVGYFMLGPLLRTSEAPHGIVSLEFAGDVKQAQSVINSWDAKARQFAVNNVLLDFLFIAAYSTAFGLACVLAHKVYASTDALAILGAPWIGTLLAWGQTVAGALDVIENIAILMMLQVNVNEPWPQVARWCALPKFGFIFAGAMYSFWGLLLALPTLLFRWAKQKRIERTKQN